MLNGVDLRSGYEFQTLLRLDVLSRQERREIHRAGYINVVTHDHVVSQRVNNATARGYTRAVAHDRAVADAHDATICINSSRVLSNYRLEDVELTAGISLECYAIARSDTVAHRDGIAYRSKNSTCRCVRSASAQSPHRELLFRRPKS